MLKIYIFTHSGGAEVALGETIIPETVGGFGDFLLFLDEEVFRASGVEVAEVGVVLFEYSKHFPRKVCFSVLR